MAVDQGGLRGFSSPPDSLRRRGHESELRAGLVPARKCLQDEARRVHRRNESALLSLFPKVYSLAYLPFPSVFSLHSSSGECLQLGLTAKVGETGEPLIRARTGGRRISMS